MTRKFLLLLLLAALAAFAESTSLQPCDLGVTSDNSAGYTGISGCAAGDTTCTVSGCANGYYSVEKVDGNCNSVGPSTKRWELSGCQKETCDRYYSTRSNPCQDGWQLNSDPCGTDCTNTDICCSPIVCKYAATTTVGYTHTGCTTAGSQCYNIRCAPGYYQTSTSTDPYSSCGTGSDANKKWSLYGCSVVTCASVGPDPCGTGTYFNGSKACLTNCNAGTCCELNHCNAPNGDVSKGYVLSGCGAKSTICTITECSSGYYRTTENPVCEKLNEDWTLKGCAKHTCSSFGIDCGDKHREDDHECGDSCSVASCCTIPRCKATGKQYNTPGCNNSPTCALETITCGDGYQQSGSITANCFQDKAEWVFTGCVKSTCGNQGSPVTCVEPQGKFLADQECNPTAPSSSHDSCASLYRCCDESECKKPNTAGYEVSGCDGPKGQCGVKCAPGYRMISGQSPTATCPSHGADFVFSGCEEEPNTCEYKFKPTCASGFVKKLTKECGSGGCDEDHCCDPTECAVAEVDRLHGCGNTCNCPNKQSCESGTSKDALGCTWDPDADDGKGMCKRRVPYGSCVAPAKCYILEHGCGNGKCGCPNEESCNNQQANGCVWTYYDNALDEDNKPVSGFCLRESTRPDECACQCGNVDCQGGYQKDSCSKDCNGGHWIEKCVITTQKFGKGKNCPCKAGAVKPNPDEGCNTQVCPATDGCKGHFYDTGDCSATCDEGVQVQTYLMLKKSDFYEPECLEMNGTVTRTVTCKANKNCKCKVKKTKEDCNCATGKKKLKTEIEEEGETCDETPGEQDDTEDCDQADLDKCPPKCKGYWDNTDSCSADCDGGVVNQIYVWPPGTGGCEIDAGTTRTYSCNTHKCKCGGHWKYGDCSKECGPGGSLVKTWNANPNADASCEYQDGYTMTESCNTEACGSDHCKGGEWKIAPGEKCDAECDTGHVLWEYKTKKECPGYGDTELRECNTDPCPEDCVGAPWKSNCTKSCGGGHRFKKYFVLVPPKHGGQKCPLEHDSKKISNCNTQPCPEDCVGKWHKEKCSAKCGGGYIVSRFKVEKKEAHEGTPCEADDDTVFSVPCNTDPCPEDCEGDWEAGECSKSCHGGTHVKTWKVKKYQKHGGKACDKPHGATQIEACNTGECIYDCQGEWVEHEGCSKSCGGGVKRHKYKITQHKTPGKGKDCLDEKGLPVGNGAIKETPCHEEPCDVDCAGGWWDHDDNKCNQPCTTSDGNPGTIKKVFHVKHGRHGNGKPCVDDQGAPIEEGEVRDFPCNIHPCGDDCVGYWTGGEDCSKSCGWGITTLTYHVFKPAENGGHGCDHPDRKQITKPCHVATCPRPPHVTSSVSEHEPQLPPVPPPDTPRVGTPCKGAWTPEGICSKTCGYGHITEVWHISVPATGAGTCEHKEGKTRTVPCTIQRCPAGVSSSSSEESTSTVGMGQDPIDCVEREKPTKCSKDCGGGYRIHEWVIDVQPKDGKKGKAKKCGHTHGEEFEGTETCNTHACPPPPKVCTRHENRDEVDDGQGGKKGGCGWTCKCPNEVSCRSGVAKDNCWWDAANNECLRIVDPSDPAVQAECDAVDASAKCYGMDAPTPANGCGKGCHCPTEQACVGPLKNDKNEFINKKCVWVADPDADKKLNTDWDPNYKAFKGKGGYCVREYSGDEAHKCHCSCDKKKCRAREDRDVKDKGGCGWTCHCPTWESCERGTSKGMCEWIGEKTDKGKGFCKRIVREDECDLLPSKCFVIHNELLTDDDKGCDGKSCACKTQESCEGHGHKNCVWTPASTYTDKNGAKQNIDATCAKLEDNDDPNNKKNPPCGCDCSGDSV